MAVWRGPHLPLLTRTPQCNDRNGGIGARRHHGVSPPIRSPLAPSGTAVDRRRPLHPSHRDGDGEAAASAWLATPETARPRGGSPESSVAELVRGSSGVEGRDGEGLIARRARSSLKLLVRSLTPAPMGQRRVVLIFGCQRSGTTMLQQTLLDRSWRVFILEEHDRRLIGDHPDPLATAWEDHGVVLGRIRRLPFEVVAVKPLVESDRATGLIDMAGDARAIWMLRHYLDVADRTCAASGSRTPIVTWRRSVRPIPRIGDAGGRPTPPGRRSSSSWPTGSSRWTPLRCSGGHGITLFRPGPRPS